MMPNQDNIFDLYAKSYETSKQSRMTLKDYLEGCKSDPKMYAGAAERMLVAIGESELIDTAKDQRLSRIYQNRTIKVYPAFRDFYGLEETIERIVGYFRHAAQGLEERKQILYLLGPVGGGKSSLADRLKDLMEKEPIYVLATKDESAPSSSTRSACSTRSRWANAGRALRHPEAHAARLHEPVGGQAPHEFGGDISKFSVVKMLPSVLRQIGVAKTEPGDENNQDISSLVGKVDIRKLELRPERPGRLQLLGRP